MLDNFGVLFSTVIIFLVILRAIQLDRTQPWFRPAKPMPDRRTMRRRQSRAAFRAP
jgi:hypothetical protein